jgi:hypothetical protein
MIGRILYAFALCAVLLGLGIMFGLWAWICIEVWLAWR